LSKKNSEDPGSWFAEPPLRGFQQRFRTTHRLWHQRSAYQTVEIYETVPFGRILVLDGAVQTTQRDEFIYHEMLALVPLISHGCPASVAIVGGGDGGTLRRVLACPTVTRVVQVELDPVVTDVCRQYLPEIAAGSFSDPRVQLIFGDGAQFLQQAEEAFDVILVDSTDPVGPALVLFSEAFYRSASRALRPGGLIVTQSGSPFLMPEELRRTAANMRQAFPLVRTYLALVPSYPGVVWSFTLGSTGPDPLALSLEAVEERLAQWRLSPRYYTPAVHFAAFALPAFLSQGCHGDSRYDLLPADETLSEQQA